MGHTSRAFQVHGAPCGRVPSFKFQVGARFRARFRVQVLSSKFQVPGLEFGILSLFGIWDFEHEISAGLPAADGCQLVTP